MFPTNKPTVTVTGNGPPSTWLMGQYRNMVYQKISEQIHLHSEYSQKKNIFVNTAWIIKGLEKQRIAAAKIKNADNVFLFSLEDPFHDFWYIQNLKNNVQEIGYTNKQNGIPLDFWCLMCNNFFYKYEEKNLLLQNKKINTFLCYQFKPHSHRQSLAYSIIKNHLDKTGIITLGKNDNQICKTQVKYKELLYLNNIYTKEVYDQKGNNDLSKTIDIYTLGCMDIWNKSFLNIVSETLCPESEYIFVTEKTYKPIIGLRPFIIFGPSKIYDWLKKAKFDIFEDMWCGHDLLKPTTTDNLVKKIIEIIKVYNKFSSEELQEIYNKLRPRLLYNRNRFFEYAIEQENLLNNIPL